MTTADTIINLINAATRIRSNSNIDRIRNSEVALRPVSLQEAGVDFEHQLMAEAFAAKHPDWTLELFEAESLVVWMASKGNSVYADIALRTVIRLVETK